MVEHHLADGVVVIQGATMHEFIHQEQLTIISPKSQQL